MEQPKTKAELSQALAGLMYRDAVDLVVDPTTGRAAASQKLDPYDGPLGTGPHALHRRNEGSQETSVPELPASPPAPPPTPSPAPTPDEAASQKPSFDERLEAHRIEGQRLRSELSLLAAADRAATRIARAVFGSTTPVASKSPARDTRDDPAARHRAACADAVRQFDEASTEAEIDAAVARLTELGKARHS